jgi:molybdate transport system substrate-binding protein
VIPDADYPPLRQRMVLLKRASPIAAQFYDFVLGDAARAIFRKHGYAVPQ